MAMESDGVIHENMLVAHVKRQVERTDVAEIGNPSVGSRNAGLYRRVRTSRNPVAQQVNASGRTEKCAREFRSSNTPVD